VERIRILFSRCTAFLFRKKLDEELEDELRSHLDFATAENRERGMSAEAARTEALRQFGRLTQVSESYRLQRGLPFTDTLVQDVRFAARQLWKSPGFAFTALLTLALGMAATLTIFRFVDSALLRPLPYTDPSRLVEVFESIGQSPRTMVSHLNYLDFERSNRVFESMAAYDVRRNFVLTDTSGAQQVNGIGVTGSFFRTLGVSPEIGRDLDANAANEDISTASATVILSYAAWQKRFNRRPDVVGKAVTLNGVPYTIIGVLPRSFHFAPTGATEFFTTLHPYATDPCEMHRVCHVMSVVARLRPGYSTQQASDDLHSIATQLEKRYPDEDRNEGTAVAPLSAVILGDIKPVLLALLGGAGLLLLIAYFNVASLLLVRSESRRHEFAVRGALGAARARLIQQFITEGFVVVITSTALGLLLAAVTRRLLLQLIPVDMLNSMPYLQADHWNWHLAGFASGLVLVACVLFAVTPAIGLPFTDLRAGLTSGDRTVAGTTWRRLGARLIVLELAATMVLLAGAGLLGKSLYKLLHIDIGFVPSHLATLQIIAPQVGYSKNQQAVALHKEIVSRLETLPGVTAVGTANGLPVGWESSTSINVVGERSLGEGHELGNRQVSAGYFSALQAQLINGRYFSEDDNATAPRVVIVNQTMVRRYFPGENPIGKQIFFHGQAEHTMQIVGVIADIREGALDEKAIPFMYTPFDQDPYRGFGIVVRTSLEAASIVPSLIATVHKIEPAIATSDAGTMPQTIRDSSSAYLHRCASWLVGGFAALALLLSVIGLYGVIAYSVSQRTREIGVRMALGAQRSSIYQLILKEAGLLVVVGIVMGLAGSLATALLMRGLLFDTQAWDASTLAAVVAVLATSALFACLIPARRAASVNAVHALRAE
jgi:macrolide transport system ATP-binding/permease protein